MQSSLPIINSGPTTFGPNTGAKTTTQLPLTVRTPSTDATLERSRQISANNVSLTPAVRGAGRLEPVDRQSNLRLSAVISAPLTAESHGAETC